MYKVWLCVKNKAKSDLISLMEIVLDVKGDIAGRKNYIF